MTTLAPVASFSRCNAFHKCRRLTWYRYCRQNQPKQEAAISVPAIFGKAGHLALELMAGGAVLDEAIAEGELKLAPLWDLDPEGVAEKFRHLLNPPFFRDLMFAYYMHHGEQGVLRAETMEINSNAIVKQEGEGAEARYWVRLPQAAGIVEVVIDLIYRRDGILRVCDHKFTTAYIKGKEEDERRSHQHRLYLLAVNRLISEPVMTATVDAIWMGSAALSPASKAMKFNRYDIEPTEGQLQETLEWFKLSNHRLEEEGEQFKQEWQWPANRGWQCKNCDFVKLCDADPIKRERLIAMDFEPRKRD